MGLSFSREGRRGLVALVGPIHNRSNPRDWRFFNITAAAPVKVRLSDAIDGLNETAKNLAAQLDELDDGPVDLYLASPDDGDAFEALAVHSILVRHKGRVTAMLDGMNGPAAAFVAQAAHKIVMAPAAAISMGPSTAFTWGNTFAQRETAAALRKIDGIQASAFAKRSGRRADTFASMMQAGKLLTADEAVGEGIADCVSASRTSNSVNGRLALLAIHDRIYPQFATDRAAVADRLARLDRDAIRWG